MNNRSNQRIICLAIIRCLRANHGLAHLGDVHSDVNALLRTTRVSKRDIAYAIWTLKYSGLVFKPSPDLAALTTLGSTMHYDEIGPLYQRIRKNDAAERLFNEIVD
jgi:hypothetical protein